MEAVNLFIYLLLQAGKQLGDVLYLSHLFKAAPILSNTFLEILPALFVIGMATEKTRPNPVLLFCTLLW